MSITTNHKYLDLIPVRESDQRMIIGTIHPHDTSKFDLDFFYGNRGSFWDILGHAFPDTNLSSLATIRSVLESNHIWMTDMILKCDRAHSGITRDSELNNLHFNKAAIARAIASSQTHTIYLTSRFGKNNAADLFCRVFGIDRKRTFDPLRSEMEIPTQYFGRAIRGVVLYSPSDDANRGIAGKAKPFRLGRDYYLQFDKPVKQFKIEHYREKFNFLDCIAR